MLWIISVVIIFFAIVLLLVLKKEERSYGSLTGTRIYQDTPDTIGDVLVATSIALKGKPDSILKEGDMMIPVEVKTGKTPTSPYKNHTMQLMAYCLLVEETYGIRPPGGLLRYPDNEFKIAYTKEAEDAVRELVYELLLKKTTDEELHCTHPEHMAIKP